MMVPATDIVLFLKIDWWLVIAVGWAGAVFLASWLNRSWWLGLVMKVALGIGPALLPASWWRWSRALVISSFAGRHADQRNATLSFNQNQSPYFTAIICLPTVEPTPLLTSAPLNLPYHRVQVQWWGADSLSLYFCWDFWLGAECSVPKRVKLRPGNVTFFHHYPPRCLLFVLASWLKSRSRSRSAL